MGSKETFNKISSIAFNTATVIKPFVPKPKESDYETGYINRYFIRKVNEIAAPIVEINRTQYNTLKKHPYYITTTFRWKIQIKAFDEISIEQSNKNILTLREFEMPGISKVLPGLRQFDKTLTRTIIFIKNAEIITADNIQEYINYDRTDNEAHYRKAIIIPPVVPVYSAESQLVFDRMSGLITAEKDAISKFVDSQVTVGNWDLIDEFHQYGLQTETNALTGWKMKMLTAVNAPTHIPGTGYAFNGSTQYIDSNLNLSTDVTQHTVSNAMMGCFVVTNGQTSGIGAIFGALDSYGFELLDDPDNSRLIYFGHNISAIIDTNNDPIASNTLYAVTQDGTNIALYANGVELQQRSKASIDIDNLDIYIGASNRNGAISYLNGTLSSFFVGAAIGFDHSNFYDNLVILNTDLAAI